MLSCSIALGIDEEISCVTHSPFIRVFSHIHHVVLKKQFQKSLTKQRLKFKLRTKVLSAEKKNGKVIVTTEAAKDGSRTRCVTTIVLFLFLREKEDSRIPRRSLKQTMYLSLLAVDPTSKVSASKSTRTGAS